MKRNRIYKRIIKKEIVLILTFVVSSIYSVSAQSHKGAISITAGYIQDGFAGIATLDYKINEYDYLQGNLQAGFSTIKTQGTEVPVDLYAVNLGFFYDILRNNNRTFALSTGAGLTVGYEVINNGDEMLQNNQLLLIDNQFIYGLYAGIEADVFIIPIITANIKISEFYHVNSRIGTLTPYLGLGVKLILF